MQTHLTAAPLLLFVLLVLSACASDTTEDTFVDATRVTETWDTPAADEVQLLMSNQSGEDRSAIVSVSIDGVEVMTQLLETGDYHNFFAFNINGIEPGEHTITFTSDDGAQLERSLNKTDEPLWVVAHYWPEEQQSGFVFELSDEAVEFA